MARGNYRRELLAHLFFPFVLAGIETGIVTVLAVNLFDGVVPQRRLDYVVALLAASKPIANLSSVLWARLNHGRSKLRFTTWLQSLVVTLVVLLAFVPRSEAGLYLFAAGVLGSRAAWAGFVTIRSTIWGANYDRPTRARVTGKLATVQMLTIAALGLGIGAAMDADARSLRLVLPAGAVLALVGVVAWSRLRVRQERRLVEQERAENLGRLGFSPLTMVSVLVRDRAFAIYMVGMFVMGLGNLMVPAVLAIVVKERFAMGYREGMLITNTIPLAITPLAIPLWARLLARMHVVRFRAIHAWAFALSNAAFAVALLGEAPWLLYAASAVWGVGFAGGSLAWNLGHLDFAPPHRATQYMAVHVTLTGVRGLIASFLGVALYRWTVDAGGDGSLVFVVATLMAAAGAGIFLLLRGMVADR